MASGDELILSQIEKQVRKLEDVIEIKELKPGQSVYRELIMVKVRANASPESRRSIAVADIFRANSCGCGKRIPDGGCLPETSPSWTRLSICWTDYEILELARTGLTGTFQRSGRRDDSSTDDGQKKRSADEA